jgi:hypothetical protein
MALGGLAAAGFSFAGGLYAWGGVYFFNSDPATRAAQRYAHARTHAHWHYAYVLRRPARGAVAHAVAGGAGGRAAGAAVLPDDVGRLQRARCAGARGEGDRRGEQRRGERRLGGRAHTHAAAGAAAPSRRDALASELGTGPATPRRRTASWRGARSASWASASSAG